MTLTCPAGWAAGRRQVLTDAATAAGFSEIDMVPEPVAAARYLLDVRADRVPSNAAVLTYDLRSDA